MPFLPGIFLLTYSSILIMLLVLLLILAASWGISCAVYCGGFGKQESPPVQRKFDIAV